MPITPPAPDAAPAGMRIVEMPATAAADFEIGDYVHADLAPYVVAGFRPSPPHIVVIVGALASGTTMTVRLPATSKHKISRAERATPAPRQLRRRHLTLVVSPAGEVTR